MAVWAVFEGEYTNAMRAPSERRARAGEAVTPSESLCTVMGSLAVHTGIGSAGTAATVAGVAEVFLSRSGASRAVCGGGRGVFAHAVRMHRESEKYFWRCTGGDEATTKLFRRGCVMLSEGRVR